MSESIQKIAIIGGTGMIGKPVTLALLQAEYDITIITRNPKLASSEFPGCAIKTGDLRDPESLQRVLAGQDAVHLNLSTHPLVNPWHFIPERDGVSTIIRCATLAGIKRISFVSSISQYLDPNGDYRWWIHRLKCGAVRALKASPLQTSVFYPAPFMESIDRGGLISGNRLVVPGVQQRRTHLISARDFGQQVAASYRISQGNHADYIIQGPEPLLPIVAARRFAAHYPHRKLTPTRIPMWPFRLFGTVSRRYAHFEHMINLLEAYQEPFLSESTWAMLGVPTITISEYAKHHASAV